MNRAHLKQAEEGKAKGRARDILSQAQTSYMGPRGPLGLKKKQEKRGKPGFNLSSVLASAFLLCSADSNYKITVKISILVKM